MLAQIKTNISVNNKFFRRNNLLFAFVSFLLIIIVLTSLPSILFFTKTKHLEIIKTVLTQLSFFTNFITPALVLLIISHHLRNRSIKIVFTKPCTPDIWLFSLFLSALLLLIALNTVVFLICTSLFIIWDIPFQWGLVYIILNNLLHGIIIFSYITFLSIIFHPVLAGLFILLFSNDLFYQLKLFLISGIKSLEDTSSLYLIKILKFFVDAIYLLLPDFSPFSKEIKVIYTSFRIIDDGIKYFTLTAIYTISVSLLFYFLSLYLLRNRRYI